MDKEQISSKQGIFIITLFIIGSSGIIGGATEAKRDSWIATILAFAAALPVVLIYARLHKLRPDQNLFEIAQWVFGKAIGKSIALLFSWYALHLSALVTRNFSEFFIGVAMPEAPVYFIALFLVAFRIVAMKSGIETMSRMASFFAPLVLLIILLTVFLGASFYNIDNLKPILDTGMQPLLDGAFGMFSFPFVEIVIFLMAFGAFRSGTSYVKVYSLGLLLGFGTLLVITLRNILILGAPLVEKIAYPSYAAVQVIRLGSFLQRFEVIVAVVLVICGFIKATTCALAATKGAAFVFNVADYRGLVSPVALFAAILSMTIYKNAMEMYEWLNVYKIYAFPFQVILPVLIWIGAECKTKLEKVAKTLAKKPQNPPNENNPATA